MCCWCPHERERGGESLVSPPPQLGGAGASCCCRVWVDIQAFHAAQRSPLTETSPEGRALLPPSRADCERPGSYSTFFDTTPVGNYGASLQPSKCESESLGPHLAFIGEGECEAIVFSVVFGWSREAIV